MIQRLFAAIAAILLVFGVATPTAANETSVEDQFVTLVNELRASQGLSQLTIDSELTQVARSWTNSLASTGELSHSPDLAVGLTHGWEKLGENVGVSPEGEIERLFEAFISSPSHYANLIDPTYDRIGVGVVYRDGRMWTTHRFMTLSDSANSGNGSSAQSLTGSVTPDTAVLSGILNDLSNV